MRADRLLKMMLLLQTRGKHTAQELSSALEVSVRTIYRDVIALSYSGIPIYTEKGPGGGIQLIEDYRTSLTGLSEEEVKALFMLNVPAAMSSLGMGEEIHQALLKLSAALPQYLQDTQAGVRQRIMIDMDWWKSGKDHTPSYLKALYTAVWEDKCIRVVVLYAFGYRAERIVEAYGLVSKGDHWYLVCRVESHFKVFALYEFESIEVLDNSFQRLKEFDLPDFWQMWLENQGNEQIGYSCTMMIATEILEYLRKTTAIEIVSVGDDTYSGQLQVTLRFEDFAHARRTILGFGGAVQVLEPVALRMSIADYSRQILMVYED